MKPQEILAQISATFKTIVQERHLHPTQLEIELNEYGNVEIYIKKRLLLRGIVLN